MDWVSADTHMWCACMNYQKKGLERARLRFSEEEEENYQASMAAAAAAAAVCLTSCSVALVFSKRSYLVAVSYTHLTLPTIYSV